MKSSVKAIKTTALVNAWLHESQSSRILHLFENACNLINERDEIISLVRPDLGAGPFALVLAETRPFPTIISLNSPLTVNRHALQIGPLFIDCHTAALWPAKVDWLRWQQQTAVWQRILPIIEQMIAAHRLNLGDETAVAQQRLTAGIQRLLKGIHTQNKEAVEAGVAQIAGLGRGLTPAGDDVLLGVLYGLWATEPAAACQPLIERIVDTAVPRTTTLSAAWLQAARRGEAAELWHDLGLSLPGEQWRDAVGRILQTGHSSGADALWGFTAVVRQNIFE